MKNKPASHPKRDPRQRAAEPLFFAIAPLMRLALRRGLPTEPNVLLTIPGRVTGRPRSTPVALWGLGNRWFVQASFGEVNWVRNLRASGEAVIRRGSWLQTVHATELAPAEAGRLMHDALAGFRRRRLLRFLLGATVRPPAAILHRYRLRIDERLEDYVAEAGRHPLFELVPRDPRTTTGPRPNDRGSSPPE
jgi:deazaflavin-dependent oxidoreductase (nitroreductase family)